MARRPLPPVSSGGPPEGVDPWVWLMEQSASMTHPEDAVPSNSLSEIFAEEPVTLKVFIEDKKFIGMSPLSPPQFMALRVCERVYYMDLYPQMAKEWGEYWDPIPMVNYLTMLIGKGGGKDMIARLVSLRIAYMLLCLKNPRTYFGMPQDESIHMLNVAATKEQARRAYFEPMTRIVKRGWFEGRCDPQKSVIEWEKGLASISGSSDAETQEGLNLILGVADEVDAFRTDDEVRRTSGATARAPMRSAEGIMKMLESSSKTRFPQTFKNLRISYPRYFGSPIMVAHKQATDSMKKHGSKSKHFVVGPMPSWEFNPLLKRSNFIEIPEAPVPIPEEFREDFEDPDKRAWAHAAYLCKPERTQLPPYFRSVPVVDASMVEMPEIQVHWSFARGAWHPEFVIPRDITPVPGAVYACHCDLAVNGDRAAFAMAHVKSWDRFKAIDEESGSEETYEMLPNVVIDALVAIEADLGADPPREIQLRVMRKLVFALRQRGFNIGSVSHDGWQSLDSRQEMEIAGIPAPLFSVDRIEDPYKMFRNCVEEGRAQLPASTLLRKELLGLSQDPRTRRIDHPPGGSKDLADACCGAVNGAAGLGGEELTEIPESEDSGEDFWVSAPLDAPIGAEEAWSSMMSPQQL